MISIASTVIIQGTDVDAIRKEPLISASISVFGTSTRLSRI